MYIELQEKNILIETLLNIRFDKIAIFLNGEWASYSGNICFEEEPALTLTSQMFIDWDVELDNELVYRYVREIESLINCSKNLDLLQWAIEE